MASVLSPPMEAVQKPPLRLFDLPMELQLSIFEYALHDPILWDRRHRDGCDLRPTEEGVTEHPPWMWHRLIVDVAFPGETREGRTRRSRAPAASYTLTSTWKFCDCAKRTGINLLRTGRHAYNVGSPIFWRASKFCFFDAVEFVACITVTSIYTRRLIRGVSMFTIEGSQGLDLRVCVRSQPGINTKSLFHLDTLSDFWDTVDLVPELEYLAVPSYFLYAFIQSYVQWSPTHILKNFQDLSRIKNFQITEMMFFGGSRDIAVSMYNDEPYFWAMLYRNVGWATFASYSQRLNMGNQTSAETILSRIRYPFERIRHTICLDLLMGGPKVLGGDNVQLAPHADLIGGCKTMTIEPRYSNHRGPELDVTFYNLPLHKEACAKSKLALANRRQESAQPGTSLYTAVWVQDADRHESMQLFESMRTRTRWSPSPAYNQAFRLYLPSSQNSAAKDGEDDQRQQPQRERKRVKKNRRGYRKGSGQDE